MIENEKNQIKVNYNFTAQEVKTLLRFFRKNENELPKGLENFIKALENSIYDCLSLNEIKDFYS